MNGEETAIASGKETAIASDEGAAISEWWGDNNQQVVKGHHAGKYGVLWHTSHTCRA